MKGLLRIVEKGQRVLVWEDTISDNFGRSGLRVESHKNTEYLEAVYLEEGDVLMITGGGAGFDYESFTTRKIWSVLTRVGVKKVWQNEADTFTRKLC